MPDQPTWTTLLTLGDSFTEGMSDELRSDGRYRGWADRLADSLAVTSPGLRYANLAIRGKLLDQVVVDQLPAALRMVGDSQTTVVTFHGGANDALRPRVDLSNLVQRYDRAVRLLSDRGVTVVLFTVIERAGGTGRTARRLAERFGEFNDAIRSTARRYDTRLVDQASVVALQDRRMWNPDRLHLAPEGHRRVAALAAHVLGSPGDRQPTSLAGWWDEPLSAPDPMSRSQTIAEDAAWIRSHLVPWVGRRLRGVSSGDGVQPKDREPQPVVTDPQP